MKRSAFTLLLSLTFASWTRAETPIPRCQMEFEGFRETTQWSKKTGKVLIEAAKACAPKLGFPLSLDQVRVEIHIQNEPIVQIESGIALYSKRRGKLILQNPIGPFQKGSFTFGEPIVLDLDLGEVKSPSGKLIRLRAGT